jgi:hypothetical protein
MTDTAPQAAQAISTLEHLLESPLMLNHREGLQAALNIAKPQAATPTEATTRFCPGCGLVGAVPATHKACCPDGSRARMVPEVLARHCHDLFALAIGRQPRAPDWAECLRLSETPEPAQAVELPDERAAFIEWLSKTYSDVYDEDKARRYWSHEHVSALAWQARAALSGKGA